MVRNAPLRERRWTLLALAQYQAGNQGEALRTIHGLKSVLLSQLGIDPGPDVVALEQAILRQDSSLLSGAPVGAAGFSCPWQGLMAYDIADAERFFGRQDDVDACLDIVRRTSFLALVGPSGSGKSSILRAGVAAALQGTRSPGHHRDARSASAPVPVRARPGARDRGAVHRPGRGGLLALRGPRRAPGVPGHVGDAGPGAVGAGRDPRRPARRRGRPRPRSAAWSSRVSTWSAPSTSVGLRQAVEEPARQAGLILEPGLVDLLVREVRDDPGALPLLSHALLETWKRREGSTLTVAGYRATGGIHDAVAQSAERLYARVDAGQPAPAPRPGAAPGLPRRPGRTRPQPGSPTAHRHRPRARPAHRDAGRCPTRHQRRRRPRGHSRGPRPRLAAIAGLARRRRRGATDPAPPLGGRRCLGHARPARQRALPRRPARPDPRLADRDLLRPHRDRTRLPQRRARRVRGRGASPPSSAPAHRLGSSAGFASCSPEPSSSSSSPSPREASRPCSPTAPPTTPRRR